MSKKRIEPDERVPQGGTIKLHAGKAGAGVGANFNAELLRYEFLVNATNDLISYIDRNYRYRVVNKAYESVFGVQKGSPVGKSVSEYWGEQVFNKKIKKMLDRCFKGATVDDQDWIECGSNGLRYMDIRYHPFVTEDGAVIEAVVVSHDVTELKVAENALRESEAHYRALVETSVDYIVKTDRDGDYIFLNPSAEKVFRLNKNYMVFVHTEDLERSRAVWDTLSQGKTLRNFENRVHGRDGQTHYINWMATPIMDKVTGEIIGSMAVGRDVTDLRGHEILVKDCKLTPREAEVYKSVVQGYTNLNIAHRLSIREATVKFYLNKIFQKTKVTNRTELAVLAASRKKGNSSS